MAEFEISKRKKKFFPKRISELSFLFDNNSPPKPKKSRQEPKQKITTNKNSGTINKKMKCTENVTKYIPKLRKYEMKAIATPFKKEVSLARKKIIFPTISKPKLTSPSSSTKNIGKPTNQLDNNTVELLSKMTIILNKLENIEANVKQVSEKVNKLEILWNKNEYEKCENNNTICAKTTPANINNDNESYKSITNMDIIPKNYELPKLTKTETNIFCATETSINQNNSSASDISDLKELLSKSSLNSPITSSSFINEQKEQMIKKPDVFSKMICKYNSMRDCVSILCTPTITKESLFMTPGTSVTRGKLISRKIQQQLLLLESEEDD